MKNPTLNEALEYPWRLVTAKEEDGTFRGEVVPNIDLVIHANTEKEIEDEWRDALTSHLRAYIATGKCIPIPYWRIASSPMTSGETSSSVVKSWEPESVQAAA